MLLAGALAAMLFAGSADAAPRRTSEVVAYGFMANVAGSGCLPTTLSRPVAGAAAIRFAPRAGAVVGDDTFVEVTDARLEGGQASWTVVPRYYECDLHADDPAWVWETGRESWAVTYEASMYAIRSQRFGGVRSIGGFRVAPRGRNYAPRLRRARRAFGRPSSVRRGRGWSNSTCRVHWRRLGLRLVFANFGGRNPCRHGLAQYGNVTGKGATSWTAVVGGSAGVTVGTDEAYLADALIGDPDPYPGARAWILAEVYVPYGDSGFIPAVRALVNRSGRVSGFDFWIGGAGD